MKSVSKKLLNLRCAKPRLVCASPHKAIQSEVRFSLGMYIGPSEQLEPPFMLGSLVNQPELHAHRIQPLRRRHHIIAQQQQSAQPRQAQQPTPSCF